MIGDMARMMFTNKQATPASVEIWCRPQDVPNIMRWYGSYHTGDSYQVRVNGKQVGKDANGDPLPGEVAP